MASSNEVSMSDSELRQAFIAAGFKPGPCTASTRKVLESVYRKMTAGEDVGKFFSQTPKSVASLDGSNNETPVEQGRYSTGRITPSQYMDKHDVASPDFVYQGVENMKPSPIKHKATIVDHDGNSSDFAELSIPVPPIMKATLSDDSRVIEETMRNVNRKSTSYSVSKSEMHCTDNLGGFGSKNRPVVSSSLFYGGSGSFDSSSVRPREPVKSMYTPVSTGGATGGDLRQRIRGAAATPSSSSKTSGSGGSKMLRIVFLILILAVLIYFGLNFFSLADNDVAMPKVTGDI